MRVHEIELYRFPDQARYFFGGKDRLKMGRKSVSQPTPTYPNYKKKYIGGITIQSC